MKILKFIFKVILAWVIFCSVAVMPTMYLVEQNFKKATLGMPQIELEQSLCWCIYEKEISFEEIPESYRTEKVSALMESANNEVIEYKFLGIIFPFIVIYDSDKKVSLSIPVYE